MSERIITLTVDAPVEVTVTVDDEGNVTHVSRETPHGMGPREVEERLDGEGRLHLLDPPEEDTSDG